MDIVLCRLDELPDGSARGFDPAATGRDRMFVVRQGQRVFAYRDACPHIDGAAMAWRKNAYLSGDCRHIACHAHGALFDIATGACVLGPCLGRSLSAIAVRQRPGGEICITDQDLFEETNS